MKIEYARNRLALLKWFFGTFIVVSAIATPLAAMDVFAGDRPILELIAGPIGVVGFTWCYTRVRKLSKNGDAALSITKDGILIDQIGRKPIPWMAIESISADREMVSRVPQIRITLKDGEIDKLGLGKLNMRLRSFGPNADKSLRFSPALYDVSATTLREEIEEHARSACGDAIHLDL